MPADGHGLAEFGMTVRGRPFRMILQARTAVMAGMTGVAASARRICRMLSMTVAGGAARVLMRLRMAPMMRGMTVPPRGAGVMAAFGGSGACPRLMVVGMASRSGARGRRGLVVMVVCGRDGRRGADYGQQQRQPRQPKEPHAASRRGGSPTLRRKPLQHHGHEIRQVFAYKPRPMRLRAGRMDPYPRRRRQEALHPLGD